MTAQNRKTGHSRLRLRWLWILLVLSLLAAALWWRGLLMQWAVQQFLQRPPFADAVVSGIDFNLDQARVKRLQLGVQTAAGPLALRLEEAQARFDLSASRIDTISVAKAELRFAYRPTENAADASAPSPAVPPLPLQRLQIDSLDLLIDTPQGAIAFQGSCELNRSTEGAMQAVFRDNQHALTLELTPDGQVASLIVTQIAGSTVLHLDNYWRDTPKQTATLAAEASALLNWLSNSSLIPANIRQSLATSVLARAMPGMSGVKLALNVDSPDDLAHLTGRLLLTRDEDYLASADLALKTADQRLKVDAHLDLTTVEIVELFKPWLPEVVNSWRFATGHAMTTLHLQWQPGAALAGTAYLRAYQVGIGFGPVQIEDGFLQLDIQDMTRFSLTLAAEVPKLVLGKETTVRDVILQARHQDNLLTIARVELPVFGGILSVLPTRVNIGQWPLALTLAVKDIDLARLLESLHYPALSGTGTLNGKLPLSLTPDSIELTNGELEGTAPGVLRYQGPSPDAENIAFKALRNMLYHSLKASVNYRPDGEYQIGLRMEGKNPQLLSGHPVAFNLNVQGQLPELLRKGLLAGDFDQTVLKQLNTDGSH